MSLLGTLWLITGYLASSAQAQGCFTSNVPVQTKCEDIKGFTNVGGSCYAPIFVGGSLTVATEECRKLHPSATLATIRCEAENKGVYDLAQTLSRRCTDFNKGDKYANQLMIGISQGKWSSGSNTTYRNWNWGEPNGGTNELGGTMFFVNDNGWQPKLKWNDYGGSTCAAMCEVVIPTSGQSCGTKPCSAEGLPCLKQKNPISPGSCASYPGFTDIGGSCYQPIFVGGKFEAMRAACKKLNPAADLATVRCDAENTGIYQLAMASDLPAKCKNFGSNIYKKQLILGLVMNKWTSESDSTYRNWRSGEPNGGTRESVGEMFFVSEGGWQPPTQWNDEQDADFCAAMCEIVVANSGRACGFTQCGAKDLDPATTTVAPVTVVIPPSKPSSGCIAHANPIVAETCAGVPGFTDVGGSCFKVVEIDGNRDVGRIACRRAHPDADLATIKCEAENKAIFGMVTEDMKKKCVPMRSRGGNNAFDGHMWIGLNDENIGDGVAWLSGASTPYRNWVSGEPNQQREVYVQLYLMSQGGEIVAEKWNDITYDATMCTAVCEVHVGTTGKGCGLQICK